MRKTLVIAVREYLATVRTKSFVISLVVLPVLMGGSIVAQALLKGQVDTRPRKFVLVDRAPPSHQLGEAVLAAIEARNEKQTTDPATGQQVQPRWDVRLERPATSEPKDVDALRLKLSDDVRRGELFGFVEIGPDVFAYQPQQAPADAPQLPDGSAVRYQTNRPLDQAFPQFVKQQVDEAAKQWRSKDAGIDRLQAEAVTRPVPLREKGLTRLKGDGSGVEEVSEEGRLIPLFAPFGLMMLMFMVIMVGATPLMQSVLEEKMQRIAEVLLGSVSPFQLMLGKLLGTVGVSLTLSGIYLGAAYWAAHRHGFTEYLSAEVLAWFVVYQMLAVLMFGSMFIAIGAACTDAKESQSMLMPVMVLVCLPLFVWFNVVREPNSAFATWFSLFPPATPMLMVARLAVPPGVAVWQPAAGVVLVLLATLGCVWAAGRIFRVGILMQGKGARVGEMLRWVVRG